MLKEYSTTIDSEIQPSLREQEQQQPPKPQDENTESESVLSFINQ